MRAIGNFLWFILGGFFMGLGQGLFTLFFQVRKGRKQRQSRRAPRPDRVSGLGVQR